MIPRSNSLMLLCSVNARSLSFSHSSISITNVLVIFIFSPPSLFTLCSHFVHTLFTLCSHFVHTLFTLCSHFVHTCGHNCDHNLVTIWSQFGHNSVKNTNTIPIMVIKMAKRSLSLLSSIFTPH